MNRQEPQTDSSWENDPVWRLLDQVPPPTASPRFVADTVRAARLAGQSKPWWHRLVSPAPLVGLATATAALVFSVLTLFEQAPRSSGQTVAVVDATQAALIQDIAETETLMAAVDHLDDFSDTDLINLIGF